ncbi:MAG: methylamine utilization protein [Hydrogenophilaceae bacterium]|nr:methylamine utilization protein [Hydrogenophilaceae bacterium]
MKRTVISLLSLVLAGFAAQALAAEHEVGQRNKQFTVKDLKIKVGDVVSFPNYDPFFHNVFSLSPTKTFDLGSYPKGETKKVTFDKAGKVDVECAIHPNMQMTILVEP